MEKFILYYTSFSTGDAGGVLRIEKTEKSDTGLIIGALVGAIVAVEIFNIITLIVVIYFLQR